jgi:nucleotide-binding universal stress UspA family protein
MIEMILVPLDGSLHAEQALRPAVRIARHTGAAILLHLSTADEALPAGPDYPLRSSEHEAKSYLRLIEQRLQRLGITTHTEVSTQSSQQSIVATAALREVNLIAMSMQGRSGSRQGLSGATAQRVIADSPVPLLLVRCVGDTSPLPETGALRRLLVPLDGTREAESVLAYLQAEGLTQDTVLTLLRVVGRGNGNGMLPASLGYGTPLASDQAEMATQHSQMEAYRYLDSTVRTAMQGASCRTRVEVGYPAKAILDTAATDGSDLVVMAVEGTAAGRPKQGSAAWHVLHNTCVPVLLLRPTVAPSAVAGKEAPARKVGVLHATGGAPVAVLQRGADDD